MTSTFLKSTLTIFACAGTLALATPSKAATIDMKADLKASSEVPPNKSKGSGSVTATYDDATKKLTWKGSYKDLSADSDEVARV